jgi:hypothetical protein
MARRRLRGDGQRQICIIVQVESRAGLDNSRRSAAVDGVDASFIGPRTWGDMGFIRDDLTRRASGTRSPIGVTADRRDGQGRGRLRWPRSQARYGARARTFWRGRG